MHTVRRTAGSVSNVVEANVLLHGEETDAFGGAGLTLWSPWCVSGCGCIGSEWPRVATSGVPRSRRDWKLPFATGS